jgi:hypothetical protein
MGGVPGWEEQTNKWKGKEIRKDDRRSKKKKITHVGSSALLPKSTQVLHSMI